MNGTEKPKDLGGPSPRLAGKLSLFLPGAGQFYLGQFFLGPVFTASWLLAIFGMVDALTTFKNTPEQKPFLLFAFLLGASSWILSPILARKRALKMTAHHPLYRWIRSKPVLRILFAREWINLVIAAAFAAISFGHFSKVPYFAMVARQVMWWWPYELLGTVFLMLYLAFLEGFTELLATPLRRFLLLVFLFIDLALGLHAIFRLPLGTLLSSGMVILPGYVPVLSFGGEWDRTRFLYRGGRAFTVLILSFFPTAFLASILERHAVRTTGMEIFERAVRLLWGASYFFFKALLDAFNQASAIRQGEGDDPRWR